MMDNTLKEIKMYLRVDEEEENDIIRLFVADGIEYLKSAIGEFDESDPSAKILLFAYVQNRYDNRELMQSDQQVKKRMEATFKSVLEQLRLKYNVRQEI